MNQAHRYRKLKQQLLLVPIEIHRAKKALGFFKHHVFLILDSGFMCLLISLRTLFLLNRGVQGLLGLGKSGIFL